MRPASLVKMGSALVGSRPYTLTCSRCASLSAEGECVNAMAIV